MIRVIDNFLEDTLKKYLEYYFLEIPHHFGHSSLGLENGGIPRYSTFFEPNDPLIRFLCFKIQEQFLYKVGFLRVYINVSYSNMPGQFHKDDGDSTVLLMTSKTLKKGSGQFQIKINNEDNNVKSIDFVQNRLIIFPASWEHRGLDPIEHATPRITLAFKIKNL
jgi:hypothetical protein